MGLQQGQGEVQQKDNNMAQQKEPTDAELWEKLNKGESHSLLKKHLTPELFEKLKSRKTKLGGTIYDCIRSGAKNLNSHVGLYACDPEAYETFVELFDAVIKDYHKCPDIKHPTPSLDKPAGSELTDLVNLDKYIEEKGGPKGMILSTRVRVGRSHDGYSFPPCLNPESRKEMFEKTETACLKLDGELKGEFFKLEKMDKATEKQLVEDHFLFKDDDAMLRDAGGYKDGPVSRAICHNKNKTFLVWVNEEDHLRFISMQMGGDIAATYNRLKTAIQKLEETLVLAKSPKLGNLTFCPTNLGTAMRASVHIKIPKLSATPEFKKICEELNLQPRGIHGENTESVGGVYDISNKQRLGLTEYEAIHKMQEGVRKIIDKELSL